MNERIMELAIRAKIQMVSEPRLQEFAELIVEECAYLVDTLHEAYDCPSTAGKFIKEHFGIKDE